MVEEGRFRTVASSVEKRFQSMPPARIALEAGTHSIWITQQWQGYGHEVLVANVTELHAIVRNISKSDQVDAEKLARYARLDPKVLRPITHRSVAASLNPGATIGRSWSCPAIAIPKPRCSKRSMESAI